MKPRLRIVLAYAAVALALSCVSLTHEWRDTVVEEGGTWEYYREVGVRNGALVSAGHIPPGPDSRAELHAPDFLPLPVYAAVGPEGGGIYVAVWFPLLVAAIVHLLWRARRDRRRRATSPAAS